MSAAGAMLMNGSASKQSGAVSFKSTLDQIEEDIL
jgi:hypothetical protein